MNTPSSFGFGSAKAVAAGGVVVAATSASALVPWAGPVAWAFLLLVVVPLMLREYLGRKVGQLLLRTPELHFDFTARLGLVPRLAEGSASSGPVLVFLHEYSARADSASKYVGFLEPLGIRILAPELEDPPVAGPRMLLAVDHVDQAVEALERARQLADGHPIVVFGVSRGAGAAVLAVAQQPEGVAAVILDGMCSSVDLVERRIQSLAPAYLGPFAAWLPRRFERSAARLGLQHAGLLLGVEYPDAREGLADLPVPVLLLHGGRDRSVPVALVPEYLELSPPGSRHLIVPGAKHNGACLEAPDAYRATILDYLAARGVGIRGAADGAEETRGATAMRSSRANT